MARRRNTATNTALQLDIYNYRVTCNVAMPCHEWFFIAFLSLPVLSTLRSLLYTLFFALPFISVFDYTFITLLARSQNKEFVVYFFIFFLGMYKCAVLYGMSRCFVLYVSMPKCAVLYVGMAQARCNLYGHVQMCFTLRHVKTCNTLCITMLCWLSFF